MTDKALNMNVSLSHYRRLLGTYLLPQRRRVLVLGLLMLLDLGLQLALPRVVQTFIDRAMAGAALETLLIIGAMYLLSAIGENWTWVGWNYVAQNVGLIATNRIRAELALHCLKLDMSFHNAHTPGEMIERVDGDVTKLGNFLSQFVIQITLNALLMAGVVVMLFTVDWRVGLPVLLGLVVALSSAGVLVRRLAALSVRERESSAELYGFLEERLSGTEDIRSNGAVDYVLGRHIDRSTQLFRASLKRALVSVISWRSLHTAFQIGSVLALVAGALLTLDGTLRIAQVYLIFAYTDMLTHPVEELMRHLDDLQQATAAMSRVQALLDQKSALVETGRAPLPLGALSTALHGVSFAYDDAREVADPSNGAGGIRANGGAQGTDCPDRQYTLHDVSLCVPAGSTLGLLGRTGSGKTTLTRLLLRLYDPTCGAVCLGGVNLRDVKNTDLRTRVAIVTQDVQLFSATVRDNLTLFDRTIDDARLLMAIDTLGLGEWLQALPNGLDTLLASGGSGLSAGEAQLLAFARAFLRDPGLVILDEASSRLDPATERKLERAIDTLLAGRTGIIIAHRLGTVQRVDQIMILGEGCVLESGARDQLACDPDSHFSQLLRTGMEAALV